MIQKVLGISLLKMVIRFEPDIVTSRQKTKLIARELGFDSQDQIRLATAVSELTRNVFQYARTGTIEFFFSYELPQFFYIVISDSGPGISAIDKILAGTYSSESGMGVGLMGAKKLMDYFDVQTSAQTGTTITIGKKLRYIISTDKIENLKPGISELISIAPTNSFEALQNQNRDLSSALDEVRIAKENLSKLNLELAETNQAMVKLYTELDGRALALQMANEALIQATEQADLANQAKSQFLSNMSHEIRTPLGIIQGFSELAMDPDLTSKERQGFLATIRRNSKNLTQLIGQILDLSKVEAGLVELEITYFSMRDLVAEVISSFELQARKKTIALKFVFEDHCPTFLTSDLMRLRQILINVIGNALKFTSHGEIVLTVNEVPNSNHQDSVLIQFLIRDTGIGLSAENQARLFQPFVQADSSTTRKYGGTGLGLSLSKKLAQALGGDLALVASSPGAGSTFSVTIRANNVAQKSQVHVSIDPTEIEFDPTNLLNGLRVLLVEDSDDNQLLFSTYLSQAGASFDIGNDGNFGVALARQNLYDVILMDVQMPNLDGYSATAILRAEGFNMPIVALTSHALKEDYDRALANGFTHYLTKPLESKTLIQTLSAFTKRAT